MKRIINTTLGSKSVNYHTGVETFEAGTYNEKSFFKDEKAFRKNEADICYFSQEGYQRYLEETNGIEQRCRDKEITRKQENREKVTAVFANGYTAYDLLKMCGGNREFTRFVFDSLSGESPEEFLASLTFTAEDFTRNGLRYLKVKKFQMIPANERKEITDSLLLPSGVKVIQGTVGDITVIIETQGHVKISWKGEYYSWRGNFPDDLVEVIKAGELGSHPEADILENNWYEVLVYRGDTLLYSDNIDMDLNDISDLDALALIKDIAAEEIKPARGMLLHIDKAEDKDGTDWQAAAMNGKTGYIRTVDSKGQLFGSWGGLALIPKIDKYHLL